MVLNLLIKQIKSADTEVFPLPLPADLLDHSLWFGCLIFCLVLSSAQAQARDFLMALEQVHNTILMEQVSEGVEEGKGERGEEWNGRKKLPKS